MKAATLNRALAAAGIDGEVSKADGVWYLAGPVFTGTVETCLHVVRLSDLTAERVLDEARRILAEQAKTEL